MRKGEGIIKQTPILTKITFVNCFIIEAVYGILKNYLSDLDKARTHDTKHKA